MAARTDCFGRAFVGMSYSVKLFILSQLFIHETHAFRRDNTVLRVVCRLGVSGDRQE